MRFLGLALFAEGATDHRFLRPLLRRLTEDVCARSARQPVEVGDVLELHSPARIRDAPRAGRIAEAAREARGAWHVLFVHADGGGDPDQTEQALIAPAAEVLKAERQTQEATVAVIPVRETEAWSLCDGEAIRSLLRTSMSDSELGLPGRVLDVEKIQDPKARLREVIDAARSGRRRKRQYAEAYLGPLGETVQLRILRQVPAFQALDRDLQQALLTLRFLDGGAP